MTPLDVVRLEMAFTSAAVADYLARRRYYARRSCVTGHVHGCACERCIPLREDAEAVWAEFSKAQRATDFAYAAWQSALATVTA